MNSLHSSCAPGLTRQRTRARLNPGVELRVVPRALEIALSILVTCALLPVILSMRLAEAMHVQEDLGGPPRRG